MSYFYKLDDYGCMGVSIESVRGIAMPKCASESLFSRWQITGLQRIQDGYFTDCSAQNLGKLQTESCAGDCFVYMFEDPDIFQSQGAASVMLVVRGCHTSITTVVSNRTKSQYGESYCEHDASHQMSNSKGEQVTVRALIIGGEVLKCYECNPQEGVNCEDKDRSCSSKKYCSKQTIHFGGGFQILKSCTNINILGVDNACVTYNVLSSPGGMTIRNKYSQCYCRDKQFCNTVSSSKLVFAIFITISVVFR
ncbi:hypothetical protein DICVIV_10939 [Dictyocaulus viviparus]|uniref:Uncharacterized protein n=1 Tax=Dictyocaulus viviparus TaxID=29172 RepID=A0A0D8XL45_DICVI|nr:hypothetical protein DICVIV_10939 [Dictyocaulus viviparus]